MRVNYKHWLIFWATTLLLFFLAALAAAPQPTPQTPPTLLISELAAANGTLLADEEGDFPDWLELHNPSPQLVNLSGWFLTDDPTQPQKWAFPNRVLPAGAYHIVFASGKDRSSTEALHTNFSLHQEGEFLGLYSVLEGRFVDQFAPHFPALPWNMTYGRAAKTNLLGFLTTPTPGQPNSMQAWAGLIAPVDFSQGRGFYNTPFTVSLATATPEAIIRYTLDGTEPTETHGQAYREPILIDGTRLLRAAAFKPGYLAAPSVTHSYLFLDQVIEQPANPPGWPAAWGLYNEFYPGLPPKGAPVLADYAMDPRITTDPRYRETLAQDLKSIPTMSLVTAPENFDIYAHALERGPEWERPVSVEFFDPGDPSRQFQINAGIRMQGVSARWEFMPKKSFRLFFKGQYGATKLTFPLFPNSPVDQFDTLVLRGGANRSYAGYPAAVDYTQVTYLRDEWMRRSQIVMSGVGSHGIFVHLYLNGLYWGLYNLVERPDASFAAAHLGGRPEDWFAMKHGGILLNAAEVGQGQAPQIKIGELIRGSDRRYEQLLDLALNHDLAVPDHYAAIKPLLDTAAFADYIILNLYAGNNDWGDNNWFIAMRQTPPGPLRYFMWDGEVTWDEGARWYLGKTTAHHRMRPLFRALMQNPDFRLEFADRLYHHLFNDGPLSDAQAQTRWLALAAEIDRAIVGESARWGDVRYPDSPIDRDDWLRAVENVRRQMDGNAAKLIALARQQGAYPPIDPPEFQLTMNNEQLANTRGQLKGKSYRLQIHNSQFTIPNSSGLAVYYTLDGSDPRQPGSDDLASTAQGYTGPLLITSTTTVKARTRAASDAATSTATAWSALREILIEVEPRLPRLEIVELMYNPPGNDDAEFIKLKNTGTAALNLAGATFDGIRYTFPAGTPPLPPGESLILIRDAVAFAERYPGLAAADVYQGQLSNSGETLTLTSAAGLVLTSLSYRTGGGWPLSPDGRGDLLLRIDVSGHPNDPKSWRGHSPTSQLPNP
jgi:hypothetical protein